jgi:hypothetical protein
VVLERAESAGELGVLGAGDVLVPEEQHLVREQQRPELGEQLVAARDLTQVDPRDFRPDRGGKPRNVHGSPDCGGCRLHVEPPIFFG